MASVDLQKQSLNEAKGKRVHFDDRLREERNHANTDIQKDKVKDNIWIGCKGYDDVLAKIEARTKEVDLLHPPKTIRKDRVTVIACTAPCPQEISDKGKENEFFEQLYEILQKQYGPENVHGISVHKDEVHTYTDYQAGEKEEKKSLIHAHFWLSPYAKWEEKGIAREGINGKNFLKKSTYNELNKAVDEMCRKEFGVAYLTGGIAGKKSVEQLKMENAKLKEAHERVEQAEAQAKDLEEKVENLSDELNARYGELRYIKELPGGMALVKKGRIEQLERIEQNYKEETPLIEQAQKDIQIAKMAQKAIQKKEETLTYQQEELVRQKAEYDACVNAAANRKISLMRDNALKFIEMKGLLDEFMKWVQELLQKITAKMS